MPATGSKTRLLTSAARLCRTVAVMIIAGVRRKIPFDEHEARIAALPRPSQVTLTALVLLGLFAASMIAAQFGIIGLALFWLGVVLLVR